MQLTVSADRLQETVPLHLIPAWQLTPNPLQREPSFFPKQAAFGAAAAGWKPADGSAKPLACWGFPWGFAHLQCCAGPPQTGFGEGEARFLRLLQKSP